MEYLMNHYSGSEIAITALQDAAQQFNGDLSSGMNTLRATNPDLAGQITVTPVASGKVTVIPAQPQEPTPSGLMSTADIRALLSESYGRGRRDAEQDARIDALEAQGVDLEGAVRGVTTGVVSHLAQHATGQKLDPSESLRYILEPLDEGTRAKIVRNLAPEFKALLDTPTISALPPVVEVEPKQPKAETK
jgi:hypothetical protein